MIDNRILTRILDNNNLFVNSLIYPLEIFEKEDPLGMPVFYIKNEKELEAAINNDSFILKKV